MQWTESASEIVVRDGHLAIRLLKREDGWLARVESSIEGKIFEGHVDEMSDLLAGNYAAGDIEEEPRA